MVISNSVLLDFYIAVNAHRNLVSHLLNKCANMLGSKLDFDVISNEIKNHDNDKLIQPLLYPFALRLFCKNNNDCKLTKEEKEMIKTALITHTISNDHHLEYFYDGPETDLYEYYSFDSDALDIVTDIPLPIKKINDLNAIVKFVADTCSVTLSKYHDNFYNHWNDWFSNVTENRYDLHEDNKLQIKELAKQVLG